MYSYDMDVAVTEFRAHLADYLDRARGGEEIVVTDRGLPVARLLGIGVASRLERLTAEGVIGRPERGERPVAGRPAVPNPGTPLSDTVADQRR